MRATAGSNRKLLLSVTGALEAATGLSLLMAPAVVVELLLGTAPGAPAGITVSRVAGVALLTLGVACWLTRAEATSPSGNGLAASMLLYNVGIVAVLILASANLTPVGIGFWPVVIAHAGMAAWCVAYLLTQDKLS